MLGLLFLVFAATPPAFHLEVAREGATRACSASDVRERVTALLGRDPFVDAGPEAVRFAVTTRSGPRWSAVIRTSGGLTPAGVRRLRAPARTCAALDETVALALALAIDPLGTSGTSRDPGPESPVRPDRPDRPDLLEEPVDTVHIAARAERRRSREGSTSPARLGLATARATTGTSRQPAPTPTSPIGWRLGVGASLGYAPEVAVAPEVGVTLGVAPWGLELGARVHTASARVDGLMTTMVVWALYADGCLGERAKVCVGLEGGVYSADAGQAEARPGELRPHLAPGLAFKLGEASEPDPSRRGGTGVEAVLRLSLPLWRQRWDVDGEAVWRMPAWIVGLGLGVRSGSGP